MIALRRPARWRRTRHSVARRLGFTLVEILVATALTLLLMAVAVNGFGLLTGSIGNNQALIETSGRLRSAQMRLQLDLRYVTARLTPPLDPDQELGYFEIVEGPGPWNSGFASIGARPVDDLGNPDSSVGDIDDVLMFTCRSFGEPFTGLPLVAGRPTQSKVAEVAWFMRGNKLYRRQLLVMPGQAVPTSGNHYNVSDVSVRQHGGSGETDSAYASMGDHLVANSLGDLTNRQNRFAHQPLAFPYDVRFWGQLGLPIMQETTDNGFPFPRYGDRSANSVIPISGWNGAAFGANRDFWGDPMVGWNSGGSPILFAPSNAAGKSPDGLMAFPNGGRVTEDVILDNVIGFDVKVWDPGAPIYEVSGVPVLPTDAAYKGLIDSGATPVAAGAFVDLFYTRGISSPGVTTAFSGPGNPKSQLHVTSPNLAAIYDTWSSYYERDGLDQDGAFGADQATDGEDNNNQAGVDDPTELETSPPYPVPLRAIQVKIRVFEPSSRQVREVTVVQDFVH